MAYMPYQYQPYGGYNPAAYLPAQNTPSSPHRPPRSPKRPREG